LFSKIIRITDVSHFHVFGNVTWAHIPNDKGKHCSLKVRSVYLLVIMKMSKVTIGPRPSFERSLVKFDHFGLRQRVEGGAQDKAEIAGSRPLFGSFLGFGNM
jgi:hypothetical protein